MTDNNRQETPTSVRIPPEQLRDLKRKADREHRTLSGQLRYIIDEWLKEK